MNNYSLFQAKIIAHAQQYLIRYGYVKVRKLTVFEELMLSLCGDLREMYQDYSLYALTQELNIDQSFVKKSLSDLVNNNMLQPNSSNYLAEDDLKVCNLQITSNGKKFFDQKLLPSKLLSQEIIMFYCPIFSDLMARSDMVKYIDQSSQINALDINWRDHLPQELEPNNEYLNSLVQNHLKTCSWFTDNCLINHEHTRFVKQGNHNVISLWFSINLNLDGKLSVNCTIPSVQSFFDNTDPSLLLDHIIRPLFANLKITEVAPLAQAPLAQAQGQPANAPLAQAPLDQGQLAHEQSANDQGAQDQLDQEQANAQGVEELSYAMVASNEQQDQDLRGEDLRLEETTLLSAVKMQPTSIELVTNSELKLGKNLRKMLVNTSNLLLLISLETYLKLNDQSNVGSDPKSPLIEFIKLVKKTNSPLPYAMGVVCTTKEECDYYNHEAQERLSALLEDPQQAQKLNYESLGWIFLSTEQLLKAQQQDQHAVRFSLVLKMLKSSLLIVSRNKKRIALIRFEDLKCTFDKACFKVPVHAHYEIPYFDLAPVLLASNKLSFAQTIAYSLFLELDNLMDHLGMMSVKELALLSKVNKLKLPNSILDYVSPIASYDELIELSKLIDAQSFSLTNMSPKLQQQLVDNILFNEPEFARINQIRIQELNFLKELNDFVTYFDAKKLDLKLLTQNHINRLTNLNLELMALQENFSHLDLSLFDELITKANLALQAIFRIFAPITPERKYAVLDTNYVMNHALELNALSLDRYIIIPNTVIRELDKHKLNSNDHSILEKARSASIAIDNLGSDKVIESLRPELLPLVSQDDKFSNDDKIITVALRYLFNDVVFYSEDRNCCLKAEGLGITTIKQQ